MTSHGHKKPLVDPNSYIYIYIYIYMTTSQCEMYCSMSFDIPGQYRHSRMRWRHPSIPMWLECVTSISSLRRLTGMTNLTGFWRNWEGSHWISWYKSSGISTSLPRAQPETISPEDFYRDLQWLPPHSPRCCRYINETTQKCPPT